METSNMNKNLADETSYWKLEQFLSLLTELTPRQEEFTRYRLGMDRDFSKSELETDIKTLVENKIIYGHTQMETAQKFGLTIERVKILEARVIRTLFGHVRHASRSKRLKDYLD